MPSNTQLKLDLLISNAIERFQSNGIEGLDAAQFTILSHKGIIKYTWKSRDWKLVSSKIEGRI